MDEFVGKVAIITGATKGIGRTAALLFAKKGIYVVAAGRTEALGRSLQEQVQEQGGKLLFVKTDVRVQEQVQHLVLRAKETFGGVDYAFNNAGVFCKMSSLVDIEEGDWNQVMETNLRGVWYCLKYELPEIFLRKGAIVNMSTSRTQRGAVGMGAYLASKAGIEALTRVASIEGSPYGVRVNTLHPGPVDDSLLHTKIPEKQIEDLKKKNPLNKLATKEEIAQAALWLLSSEAGHINGTSLCIDGGESLII